MFPLREKYARVSQTQIEMSVEEPVAISETAVEHAHVYLEVIQIPNSLGFVLVSELLLNLCFHYVDGGRVEL